MTIILTKGYFIIRRNCFSVQKKATPCKDDFVLYYSIYLSVSKHCFAYLFLCVGGGKSTRRLPAQMSKQFLFYTCAELIKIFKHDFQSVYFLLRVVMPTVPFFVR